MQIITRDTRCSGCRLCQQICAITHFQEINPKKSAIRIKAKFPRPGVFTPVLCDQCGECAEVCPSGAIEMESGRYVIDKEACTLCEACVDACPKGAIHVPVGADHPVKCVLCMKCTEVCNTGAIVAQNEYSVGKDSIPCMDSAGRRCA